MDLRNTSGFWPVALALLGNSVVAIAKFGAAFMSGSSVMFSEAIHSVADTMNQALLLVGLRRSLKKADDSFEYGYGNERFFWALISACGIFFVGAGVTAYKGITTLLEPHEIGFSSIIFAVLLFAFVVELYTFLVAASALNKSFPDAGFVERLSLADPMTLAVYLEDAVAVLGVGVAAFSLLLSYYTGNIVWDALGSIFISFLLASVAIVLIMKNRSYLIGRSMPKELQDEVVE
ncbi:MAG: cation diffusion facilitator family transporter, partial [Patescibacteria group bacterium]